MRLYEDFKELCRSTTVSDLVLMWIIAILADFTIAIFEEHHDSLAEAVSLFGYISAFVITLIMLVLFKKRRVCE